MKKILIIGNAGYIGSRLEKHLEDIHDVAGVDTEWFGEGSSKTIKKDYRNLPADVIKAADVIILLAGHSGVKMCDNEIQHSWRNNVSNFVDLVGKMRRDQQLIYASSGSVYGNANSDIFQPVNNYDITKYVLDLEAQRFINDGYKILGLRFGTVNGYSPNLRTELMINAMVNNAINLGKITINNKYVRRPILALSDVCGAMEAMIDVAAPRSGIYDLCSFNDRVIDIAEDVCQYMDVELEETPDRAGVYDFIINNERFSREFDYRFTGTRQDVIGEVAANLGRCRKGDRNTPKEYQ